MKFKEFLDKLKSEKYLLIFLFIFLILVYCIYKNMSFCIKNIENMTILEDKQITESVNKFYSSDDFVRSITTVFQKIQANGLQIEGNIDLTGNVKADGEISNQNISLTSFSKKIDDKAKLIADRKAAEENRKYQQWLQERERQNRIDAENQRRADEAREAERRRIAALGTCGGTTSRGGCPVGGPSVRCPNGQIYGNSCIAQRAGCTGCPSAR
jgi:hypothetical protein